MKKILLAAVGRWDLGGQLGSNEMKVSTRVWEWRWQDLDTEKMYFKQDEVGRCYR